MLGDVRYRSAKQPASLSSSSVFELCQFSKCRTHQRRNLSCRTPLRWGMRSTWNMAFPSLAAHHEAATAMANANGAVYSASSLLVYVTPTPVNCRSHPSCERSTWDLHCAPMKTHALYLLLRQEMASSPLPAANASADFWLGFPVWSPSLAAKDPGRDPFFTLGRQTAQCPQ